MTRAPVLALTAAGLALAACGGGDDPAPAPALAGEGGSLKVAALGDSITAGSPLWDPDQAIRDQIGAPDEESQFEYWASDADPELAFTNCGVFGERTDQIALRLDDCADGADVLIVQGGINDIAQGRPVDDAAGDLRSMVRRGKELGPAVYLVEVLPWNNGHPGADGPIETLNREIRTTGKQESVPVIAFHDALEDPSEPGTMKPQLTIDGDHPSVAGYRILGGMTAQALG